MPSTADYSRPVTPENGVNGSSNGLISPRTPKHTGLALTEYSANPSPPSEDPKSQAQKAIPEEYILPNGTPDVSIKSPVAREGI
jgi:threonine dehydratase